ncbi:hypothetical protein NUW58_g3840 [Xylaria curta]|uniref:Uncharacterized protein n=1 Tax=Xylaria curta TaxID=42375 RepID=A0ACC1PBE9_9PEZI|nr:hypothetical protein NUW58_g3840 [Xylaria curta]
MASSVYDDSTASAAHLCTKCQVIVFDRQFEQSFGVTSQVDGDRHLLMEDEKTVTLDYLFEDFAPHFPNISKSADAGCEFCHCLHETFTMDGYTKEMLGELPGENGDGHAVVIALEYIYDDEEAEKNDHENGVLRLHATLTLAGAEEVWLSFDFTVEGVPGHEDIAKWLCIDVSLIIGDRLASECTGWARSKIDCCVTSHIHPLPASGFCPERLIDVQSQLVKLVSKENTPRTKRKTTEESLQQRLTEIKYEAMSPVLHDAVQVARSLSIPYLWVDALCVIQGHGGDWESQSRVMDKIYGSAHITIAALASGSCNEQFRFATRRPLYVAFRSAIDPNLAGLVRLRYVGIGRFDKLRRSELVNQITFNNIVNSRWRSRGWTFQEDVTSTRVLFFGPSELFFTCPSSQQYLGGPDVPDTCGDRIADPVYKWANNFQTHFYWLEFASNYSERCDFTHSTDLLPAIAGLAAFFQKKFKCPSRDYLAGLWRAHLYVGALWCMTSPFEGTLSQYLEEVITRPYRCPSWSWAGHGAVIFLCFDHFKYRKRCRIKASTTLKGSNPYGEITDSVLRFTGIMATLNSKFIVRADDWEDLGSWCKWRPKRSALYRSWRFWLDWRPVTDTEPWGKLKMVLLGSAQLAEAEGRSVFGLVVREIRQNSEKFCRAGVFFSTPGVDFTQEGGLTLTAEGKVVSIDIV